MNHMSRLFDVFNWLLFVSNNFHYGVTAYN